MSLLEAIVLGIVQGLTEFLPISSTAHLIIVPALVGMTRPDAAFSAVIQIGTLAAVLAYFRADVLRIARAVLIGLWQRDPLGTPDAKLGWMIAAGTVPIVICGLAFKEHIETTLRSLYVISASLVIVALAMELAEELMLRRFRSHRPQKEIGDVTWVDSLWIGAAQAIALIPGVSRSGITITAGLFRNLSRPTAAKFSFLLSLPAIFGAGLKELIDERDELLASSDHITSLVVATVVSGIVGYFAIAFLLGYLRTRTTRVFVIYRIALAVVLLTLLWTGRISSG